MVDEPDEIEIPYMLLADAAESVGGKLYLLGGGWDNLMLPGLPGRGPKPFALALGIRVPYSHTNRKFQLAIELIDGDGGPIGDSLKAQLESGRPPGITPGTAQNLPLGISTHPEFPAAGPYAFVARIDGAIKNKVAFSVSDLQLPMMPAP